MTKTTKPKAKPIPKKWLRAALDEVKSDQSDLARRLKVDVSTVHRWCVGAASISTARWIAITSVLGLAVDWTPPAVPKVKGPAGGAR